jgi:glycerophosphoryl diester phosphodiesterase
LEAKKIKAEAVLPRWPLATPKAVAFAHRLKLKVIPWVVNDEKSLQRVLEAKADAIATDRVSWLVEKRKEIKEKNTY